MEPGTGTPLRCQLEDFIELHGKTLHLRGREFRIEDIRAHELRGHVADAYSPRAKYLCHRIKGVVAGRPGAEVWAIIRPSGGGAYQAKFAIRDGRLRELD